MTSRSGGWPANRLAEAVGGQAYAPTAHVPPSANPWQLPFFHAACPPPSLRHQWPRCRMERRGEGERREREREREKEREKERERQRTRNGEEEIDRESEKRRVEKESGRGG